MADVHVMTLRRAAQIAGGVDQLASFLKITPSHLSLWLDGIEAPPSEVFLRAVDLVTEDGVSRISSQPKS